MTPVKLQTCPLPTFDDNETALLTNFQQNCSDLSKLCSSSSIEFDFEYIAKLSNINISKYNKFGNNKLPQFYIAMWICFLEYVIQDIHPNKYKYQSIDEFLNEYKFKDITSDESNKLFSFANWMEIFLTKNKKKRIKGVSLQVIALNIYIHIYKVMLSQYIVGY